MCSVCPAIMQNIFTVFFSNPPSIFHWSIQFITSICAKFISSQLTASHIIKNTQPHSRHSHSHFPLNPLNHSRKAKTKQTKKTSNSRELKPPINRVYPRTKSRKGLEEEFFVPNKTPATFLQCGVGGNFHIAPTFACTSYHHFVVIRNDSRVVVPSSEKRG